MLHFQVLGIERNVGEISVEIDQIVEIGIVLLRELSFVAKKEALLECDDGISMILLDLIVVLSCLFEFSFLAFDREAYAVHVIKKMLDLLRVLFLLCQN